MAGSERELGVSITARNATSSGVTGAITEVERLNLAVKMAGGTFAGLNEAQLRAIESAAGLARGTLQATAAIEAQANALRNTADSLGLSADAFTRYTTTTAANLEKLRLLNATTAASFHDLGGAIAMSMDVGSDRQILSASASARVLATSLSAAAAEDSYLRDQAYAAAAALRVQQSEEAALEAQTNLTTSSIAGMMRVNSETSVIAAISALKEEAGTLAALEAQVNLTGASVANFNRVQSEMAYAAAITGIKEEAAALASLEAQSNMTAASMAGSQRFAAESGMYSVVAVTEQWAQALRTTGAAAGEAHGRIEQLYNVGSVQRRTLSQGIDAGMTGRHANASREDAAVAFGGRVDHSVAPAPKAKPAEALQAYSYQRNEAATNRLMDAQHELQATYKVTSLDAEQFWAAAENRRNGGQSGAPSSAKASAKAFMGSGLLDQKEEKVVSSGVSFGSQEAGLRSVGRSANVAGNEMKHLVGLFDEANRHQFGQMLSTLGASLRDAGLSAGTLATSFGAFIAVISVGAVLKGAESMGKWADGAKAIAAASGMSVKSVTEIQGALQLTGAKADDADRAIRKFAQSMSQALGDSSSRAAQAFHALNMTQEELVLHSKDADGGFRFFVQRLNEAENSSNKAAAGNILVGQSFQKLAPAIDKGVASYDAYIQKANELHLTLDDKTADALIATGEKVDALAKTMTGKGIAAFEAWLPEIDSFIDGLTRLGSSVGEITADIGKLANVHIPDWMMHGLAGGMKQIIPGVGNMQPLLDAGAKGMSHLTGSDWAGSAGSLKDWSGSSGSMTKDPSPKFQVPSPTGGTSEKGDIGLELANARRDAAQSTKDAAQQHINEIKAEIKVYDAHIKAMKTAPPSAGGEEGGEEGMGNAKLMEQLQTSMANKQAELAEAQLRGSNKGQPTAGNELAARIAQAKLAVESLSGTTKDASIAGAEAAIDELQRTLEVEKLTAKERMQVETELANTKIALHSKVLAQTQSKQIDEIKGTLTTTTETQKSDQVSSKFSALAGGKPENNLASAQAQSLQILASGEQAIQKLQEMASAGNMTTESIQKINQAIAEIKTDTMSRMIELFNSAGAAAKTSADVFSNVWNQTFSSLDKSMDSFASDVTKAVIAPQQELIKAGLTTIHVNMEGTQIRAAAQKVFLGLASDFASSVMSGLSQVAAKQVFGAALAPGAGLGQGIANWIGGGKSGSGQAAGFGITGKSASALSGGSKGADLGTSAAGLQAFNAALKMATKTLSTQSGSAQEVVSANKTEASASQTTAASKQLEQGTTTSATAATAVNTGATSINTGTVTANTAGTAVHTAAVDADSSGFITHLLKIGADTAAEIWHTIVTLMSLEGGGVIPSAAGGMVVGGGLGGARGGILSILHPKEMVLPAHLSTGVQNMINSGGAKSEGKQGSQGNTSVHSSTLNYSPSINAGKGGMSRAEMSQMMGSQASSFAGQARNLMRKGWRP